SSSPFAFDGSGQAAGISHVSLKKSSSWPCFDRLNEPNNSTMRVASLSGGSPSSTQVGASRSISAGSPSSNAARRATPVELISYPRPPGMYAGCFFPKNPKIDPLFVVTHTGDRLLLANPTYLYVACIVVLKIDAITSILFDLGSRPVIVTRYKDIS
ncbi:MAG: hypothetical protein ACPHCI_02065, partial [Solirubrobacterales bacterium]